MKWLLGLITSHLGTKLMALVLAVVLYAFVHQGLSAEREFDLRLRFVLDPSLDKDYVLMTPRVDVNGLVLQGLREKLDAWEDGQSKPPEIEISVDKTFIGRYRRGDAAIIVPMTTGFFEDNKIFARAEITAKSVPPAGADLEIDLRRKVTFDLTIGDSELKKLDLAPGSAFSPVGGSGRRVRVEFKPGKQVVISGPAQRLTGVPEQNPKLYVWLPDVNLAIEKERATLIEREGTITTELEGFDWGASGLPKNQGDRELLRVEQPPGTLIANLHNEIKITFKIQQANEKVTAKMRLRVELPASALLGTDLSGFLDRYELQRESIALTPSADWKTCKLGLLVPKSLSDNGDFVRSARFMVVIELPDPAQWEPDKDVEALVRLSPIDPLDFESARLLQQIQIALNEGEQPPPKVRFTPN